MRFDLVDTHHKGYPQVAAFNVNHNSLICRKFGYLRTRLLLQFQAELVELEDQLMYLDDDDSEQCPHALQSREIDESRGENLSRKRMFGMIHQKLKDYGIRVFAGPLECSANPDTR